MSQTTARLRREAAKVDVARELSRARVAADLDQSEVADACGVPRQVPSVWESKEGAKSPLVADLHLMPAPVAVALVRQAALVHGHDVAPVTDAGVDASSLESLHTLLKSCSEVQVRHSAALIDGMVDAQEAADIERLAQAASDALAALARSARGIRLKPVKGGAL